MIPATAAAAAKAVAKAAAEGASPAAAAENGKGSERRQQSMDMLIERTMRMNMFTSAHVVTRVGEPGGKGAWRSKGEWRSSPYGAGPSYYAVPKACVQPNPTPAPKAEPDPEPAVAGQLAGPTPSSTPAPKPAPTPPTRVHTQDLEDTQGEMDNETLVMAGDLQAPEDLEDTQNVEDRMEDTQQGAEESSADEFWNGIEG